MNSSDSPGPSRKMPGGAWKPSHDTPTDSQLLPILSELPKLRRKGLLIPGFITVATAVFLGFVYQHYVALAGQGAPADPAMLKAVVSQFELILGAYLCLACFYVVYMTCGKSKPAWLLASSAVCTILVMSVYVTFTGGLVAQLLAAVSQMGVLQGFFSLVFGVGIPEELIKSIPVLLGVLVGLRLTSPHREKLGVLEPLDGVLIAAASACGFALNETLGYAFIWGGTVTPPAGMVIPPLGDWGGLPLLILRLMQNISSHVAYSACLGYYIGLAILKPAKRWQSLGIGFGMAVFLHAAWDTAADQGYGLTVQLILALFSFCVLATAILKARQISPMRRENWATTVSSSSIISPPLQAQPQPLPVPHPTIAGTVPSPVPVVIGPLVLRVGATRVPLTAGLALTEQELPGLAPLTGQMVAEVSANPRNPEVLGLKNQSVGVWSIRDPEKGILKISPGQTFRVLPGTRVNFGSMFGEVERG